MAASQDRSPMSAALTWLFRGVGVLALGVIALVILNPTWLSGQLAEDETEQESTRQASDAQADAAEDYRFPDVEPSLGNEAAGPDQLPNEDRNADDRNGQAESPIIGGVSQLLGQIASATGAEELDLSDVLSEADQELARTKRSNQQAMREANRRFRRVSAGDKHLVLITVEGLCHADLQEATSQLRILPAMGRVSLQFTQFYSQPDADMAWQSFHRATNAVSPTRSQESQVRYVLSAGYQTALIGDCSHAPVFAGAEDRNYDFRFGLESWRDRDASQHDSLWSNGVELKIQEARARSRERIEDLCVLEAADFIFRERGQRPFFLHVALSLSGSDTSPGSPDDRIAGLIRLDQQLERLLRSAHEADIESKTVFILAGIGSQQEVIPWKNAAAVPVPLMMYWPGRSAEGKRVESPCGVLDLLPTIRDWSDSKAESPTQGVSLAPSRLAELASEQRVITWKQEGQDAVICQNPWTLVATDSPWLLKARAGEKGLVVSSSASPSSQLDDNLAEQHPEITSQLMRVIE